MTPGTLRPALGAFADERDFRGKGPLCVALVVTQHARTIGLPLDHARLLTEGEGQVLGLGRGAVQDILGRHGVTRVLAAEGGRTSRGSIGNMRRYVDFLNGLALEGAIDFAAIERFWIERVHAFFAAKPFRLKLDAARGLRAAVRDLLAQAEERQKTTPGVAYAGAVMQHLVGATLDCALGPGQCQHNSFSTADAASGRAGDFVLGDVAIHVTTSPGEAVVERCRDNLNQGHTPVLITGRRGLPLAEGLAENKGLANRIDVFEIEQFVAANLHERGRFTAGGRRDALQHLVARYNGTIDEVETDPSLRIEAQ